MNETFLGFHTQKTIPSYNEEFVVFFFVRFLHAYVIVLTHNFCIGLASFSDLVGEQESEVYTVYAFTKLPRLPCMLVCYTKCTVYCLLA